MLMSGSGDRPIVISCAHSGQRPLRWQLPWRACCQSSQQRVSPAPFFPPLPSPLLWQVSARANPDSSGAAQWQRHLAAAAAVRRRQRASGCRQQRGHRRPTLRSRTRRCCWSRVSVVKGSQPFTKGTCLGSAGAAQRCGAQCSDPSSVGSCSTHHTRPPLPPPAAAAFDSKDRWADYLRQAGLRVRVHPQDTGGGAADLQRVEFAIAWNPPPGLLAQVRAGVCLTLRCSRQARGWCAGGGNAGGRQARVLASPLHGALHPCPAAAWPACRPLQCPNLKAIQSMGAGELPACRRTAALH